ncbi:hypothetical protein ABZX90_12295 [Streptomyces sp. NPDC002935]|uniref:hypothetical protein n=1 Tax=Streptomyces sp. NPDC002935 TaxID=3154545 RepID=UPI0033BEB788
MTKRRLWTVTGGVVTAVVALCALLIAGSGEEEPGTVLTGSSDHYDVRVRLDLLTTATTTADIEVTGRGRDPGDLGGVSVEAVMERMGHAMPPLAAEALGDGRFRARGQLFVMAGEWELGVRLRTAHGASELATVTVVVPSGA